MISEYKTLAREALHGAMSEPASYTAPGLGGAVTPDADQIADGLSLKVRWHNKLKIVGERGPDDVGIIEGINRLVFNSDNLAELGLTLARLAIVTIPGLGKTLRLDSLEEPDGPLNVYWGVIEL